MTKSRARSVVVVIDHDDIGDEMFMRPVGRVLAAYAEMLINMEAGHDSRESFKTSDGFCITATVCNPPLETHLMTGEYKEPRGPYISYDWCGRATHHEAPDS